jgi:hypothetical protein
MKLKLQCKICGGQHAATEKNFPVAFREFQEVFEGKGKKRKSIGHQQVITGYGCRWCVEKHAVRQFIKQHNIKPRHGQRLMDAVRNKAEELKKAAKFNVARPQQQKIGKWEKIKGWTKSRFFKRGGQK